MRCNTACLLTLAADALGTTGAGSLAHRGRPLQRHTSFSRSQPITNPSSHSNHNCNPNSNSKVGGRTRDEGADLGAHDSIAAALCYLATSLDKFIAGDVATKTACLHGKHGATAPHHDAKNSRLVEGYSCTPPATHHQLSPSTYPPGSAGEPMYHTQWCCI